MNASLRMLRYTRRSFLRLGAAGLCDLTLPRLLHAEQQRSGKTRKAKNVIFIWQQGGPPHQDTWDMKPEALAAYRGEFRPIATATPGYQVCELMPRLAQQTQRLCVLRSVNHHIAEHNPGSMFMLGSGNPPGTVAHPTWSAVVAKEVEAANRKIVGVPTAVAVPIEPSEGPGPGLLGPAYRSFATHADPSSSTFRVQSLGLPPGLDEARLQGRKELLDQADRYFGAEADRTAPLLQGLDRFNRDAYEIIRSSRTQAAFAIEQEPEKLRERYGRFKLGQRLLLARRLVESGVRFVTINEPEGWDTHARNFERCRKTLLPTLDQALSALVEDLAERGLLEETLVMVFGEFGRTPVINKQAGRDHWPQAMSIVLAGGGVPAGVQHGTTDRNGWAVKDDPHSPADFACTIYSLLGINPHKEYSSPSGQPVPIVKGGAPIKAIVG